ncbi:hypothetical protein GGR53DRAFT_526368, partial [Hypoxylon sp. FL1150]
PPFFSESINRLYCAKGTWEDALVDPYHLVEVAFKTWYQMVDEQAWNVLKMARDEEMMTLKQSSLAAPSELGLVEINYSRIHHRAKDALHLIEAVDAVLLSLECALGEHGEMQRDAGSIWKTVHDNLRHRRETFRSTRLQLSSIDKRLKNVINLAFNIGTLRDSKVMREDSYVMKILTMIALIFVPIGTVAAIFGSQFFGTREINLPDGAQHVPRIVDDISRVIQDTIREGYPANPCLLCRTSRPWPTGQGQQEAGVALRIVQTIRRSEDGTEPQNGAGRNSSRPRAHKTTTVCGGGPSPPIAYTQPCCGCLLAVKAWPEKTSCLPTEVMTSHVDIMSTTREETSSTLREQAPSRRSLHGSPRYKVGDAVETVYCNREKNSITSSLELPVSPNAVGCLCWRPCLTLWGSHEYHCKKLQERLALCRVGQVIKAAAFDLL